jgi:MucR family transcriptional regulator, transcriptional regulator of exopolysaccharide biosynthesis
VNTEKINPRLTAMIVKSYVVQHKVRPEQLSDLITSVHSALGQLGQPVVTEEVLVPAVSVRRSVHQDYVVCLDCGYRGKTLLRHISASHRLNRDEYLRRWGLKSDHPLTAPAYSERRSTMAKALWFGRKSTAQATPEVPPPATPTPVDVDRSSEAKPARRRSRVASKSADVTSEAVADPTPTRRRRSRSASKSPDSGNEAAIEPKPTRKRRPRSRVASTQPEQTSSPTAET